MPYPNSGVFMKKLSLATLSIVLLSQPLMASETQGSRGFFNCARKVIGKQVSGIEGIEQLKSAFEVAAKGDFKKAKKSCKELLKSGKPDRTMDREDYLDQANRVISTNSSYGIETTMYKFLFPSVRCTTLGLGASGGLIATIGASAEIGKCRSSDGRRYAIVAASGELGFGAGASIHLTGMQFKIDTKDILEVVSSQGITYGTGVSFGLNVDGGEVAGFNVGAGLGLIASNKLGVAVKFMPLLSSNKDLIEGLK